MQQNIWRCCACIGSRLMTAIARCLNKSLTSIKDCEGDSSVPFTCQNVAIPSISFKCWHRKQSQVVIYRDT